VDAPPDPRKVPYTNWPVSSHAVLGGDPRRRSSSRRATTACCASRSTPTAGSSARTITDPGVPEEQASDTRARGYASEDGGTATGSGRSRRPCATRREGRSPRSSPAATRQVRRSRADPLPRHRSCSRADPGLLDEFLETFAADDTRSSVPPSTSRLRSLGRASVSAPAARTCETGRSGYPVAAVGWVSPAVLSAASTRRARSSMSLANWVTASSAPFSPQPAT
jgi:hypothetical protein